MENSNTIFFAIAFLITCVVKSRRSNQGLVMAIASFRNNSVFRSLSGRSGHEPNFMSMHPRMLRLAGKRDRQHAERSRYSDELDPSTSLREGRKRGASFFWYLEATDASRSSRDF
jgi:hypothetical protein